MTPLSIRLAIVCGVAGGLCLAGQVAAVPAAAALTYEAPLPAQIFTDPNLCAHVPCLEVMPGADSFSERKGKPSYVDAYRTEANGKKRVGYVFLSTDTVDNPGYAGRPIVTLIGMDTSGRITGAKLLRHEESILKLGVPEENLTRFVSQYVGKFVGDRIVIGKSHEAKGHVGLDAITGATVTSVAQNQVMLRSGIEIARQVGIIKPAIRPQAVFADSEGRLGWDEMVSEGSIQRLNVSAGDIGAEGDGDYLDMYFGYLNAPSVGKSILGEHGYDDLMSRLRPGEHAIFIIANGAGSFKGSGHARGGIYERIQVVQGIDTFTFRDLDYLNLGGIEAANAPAYRESGIFIIRGGSFSGAYPWRLVLLASKVDKETGAKTFTSFEKEYSLPARHLEGGRPEVAPRESPWLKLWKTWGASIIIVLLLAAAVLVYLLHGKAHRSWRAGR